MEHQVLSPRLLQEGDGEYIAVYQNVVASTGVLCCGKYFITGVMAYS